MLEATLRIWLTPGISELLAALLGGGVTMGAQFLALRHDREKEAHRQVTEQKAWGWAIYFKISQAHEALTATATELRNHRVRADSNHHELWQECQFLPHDWNTVNWDVNELVFLIDHKKFDLMARYQEAIMWLSNLGSVDKGDSQAG